MITLPDVFVVNWVQHFASECGRCSRMFFGPAVVLFWLNLAVGSAAAACDDDEDEAPAPAAAQQQIVISNQQFDQMMFAGRQTVVMANGVQQISVTGQPTATAYRERMSASAAAEIEAVDRRVSLNDAQKKKLKLAAKGDIAQFISRVDELRPKLTSKPLSQQEYVEILRELNPLRMSQQYGIISENSLFRKTLRRTLTDEQRVLWQALERERQKTIIEAALIQWNAHQAVVGVKLTGESQQKLTELILDHGRMPLSVGPYGQYIVVLEANLLRDRVKPLLSVEEWDRFDWKVGQAKRFVPTLESYGLWTERRSSMDDEEVSDMTKK